MLTCYRKLIDIALNISETADCATGQIAYNECELLIRIEVRCRKVVKIHNW